MISKKEAKQKGLNIIDSTQENNPLKSLLEKNFPDVLSEGQISLKALTMLLGLNPDSNTQGYELTFTGKGLANTLYSAPTEYELSEEVERSKERESTQNSIIIGDNLDILKILKSAYYEKIKMIYIDPPYNTKSENFIYPDDFRKDYRKILREVGLLEIDAEGNEIESKTLQAFRNITGSKSHSGWLSFMLPRLKLARDLLREDGVIFISIDDNEQANLKLLCDEIFGEDNFVSCFIWETKKGAQGMTTQNHIVTNHEYILTYSKDKENFRFFGIKRDKEGFSNPDNDKRGLWKRQYLQRLGQNLPVRTIVDPHTNIAYSFETPYSQEKLDHWIAENKILFPKNKKGYPARKEFLSEYKNNKQIITNLGCYATKATTEKLYTLFDGTKIFTNPKPDTLLKFLLEITISQDDIVLDFFAGSGTMAQAVMELNAKDGGNRKFILAQLPEAIDKNKNKIAYDFVKNELGRSEPKISDITIERINRAGEKLKKENKNQKIDIGYCVYSLAKKAKLSDEGHIIPHSASITPQDIARNLALFAGKPLYISLEELVKDKLFACDDILCVVEIDKKVEQKILKEPNKAIFIDGYGAYSLESFLNLNISNYARVNIVY